jgi:hypothetical protein
MRRAQENVMGYNRSGKTRKDRLKRRKKHEQRLARKAAQSQAPPAGGTPAGSAGAR